MKGAQPSGARARRGAAVLGAILSLLGCRQEPPVKPTTVEDLTYPVLVIHDGISVDVNRSRDSLLVMTTQLVISRTDDPVLIDSRWQAYTMRNLRSTKSTFGLILSAGTGSTPVAFDLIPRPDDSGLEAARARIVATRFLSRTLGDPELNEACHAAIAKATTMEEIIRVLEQ